MIDRQDPDQPPDGIGISPRKDKKTGELIPRRIINRFTAEYNGEMVLDVELHGAISTNPYFEFDATVPEPGSFTFTWYDDDGDVYTATDEQSF